MPPRSASASCWSFDPPHRRVAMPIRDEPAPVVCELMIHRIGAEPRTCRCCRGGRQRDAQTAARSFSHQVLQASLCGEPSSVVQVAIKSVSEPDDELPRPFRRLRLLNTFTSAVRDDPTRQKGFLDPLQRLLGSLRIRYALGLDSSCIRKLQSDWRVPKNGLAELVAQPSRRLHKPPTPPSAIWCRLSGLDENQRVVFYEEHKNVCIDTSR